RSPLSCSTRGGSVSGEMEQCEYCGSPMANCGPPINEDYCTNKDCTGMRDAMFASVRERIAKDKALRDATPDLLEIAETMLAFARSGAAFVYPPGSLQRLEQVVAKARGQQ